MKHGCLPGALAMALTVLFCPQTGTAAPPPPGAAAVLYGRLASAPEQRPLARHTVKLQCPPALDEGVAVTDDRGGFTLVLVAAPRGSCRLWVELGERRSAPVEVFVAGSSLRYDLLLDAQFGLRKR